MRFILLAFSLIVLAIDWLFLASLLLIAWGVQ